MMIHHISIPANNPLHVAQVLAEVLDGKVGIFPPNPNSYMVAAGDEYGTLIEIYPSNSEIVPGVGDRPQIPQRYASQELGTTHA